jgi:hypothetical protein
VRRALGLLACLLVCAAHLVFAADSKQKSYETARQQAREMTDIFAAGPLQIQAKFRVHVLSGEFGGSYQYSQIEKDEYREDFQIVDFHELVVYRRGERFVQRSKDLEPLPIWYVRELVYLSRTAVGKAPVSKLRTTTQNGENVRCYSFERGAFGPSEFSGYEACFEVNTGPLATVEWSFNNELHRFEYSNFLHDQDKLFPGTMRRFRNGALIAEVNVDAITHSPADAKLLDPPTGALKEDACSTFKPAEAEYRSGYFQIRSEYKSASVVIAGSLDDRGKIREAEIQQSGGPKIDAAALRAIKEIHFRPAKCDGRAISSMFRLEIWFSPALHPDLFQSFR